MEWTVEHRKAQGFAVVATRGDFTLHAHPRMIEDSVSRDFWRPGLAVLFRPPGDGPRHDGARGGAAGVEEPRGQRRAHRRRQGGAADAQAGGLRRGRHFEMMTEGRVDAMVQVFLDETEARSAGCGGTDPASRADA